MTTHPPETLNRSILRLALPALGALIAEPLFLIVDAAMVGHLGVAPLAGLGIAGAVLQTIVGLMVFLAYSTTPAVARRYGAGEYGRAVRVHNSGTRSRCTPRRPDRTWIAGVVRAARPSPRPPQRATRAAPPTPHRPGALILSP